MKMNTRETRFLEALSCYDKAAEIINEGTPTGRMVLMAADSCEPEILKLALEKGGDPNFVDDELVCNFTSPLLAAMNFGFSEKGQNMVKTLLEHGANIDMKDPCFGTPLKYQINYYRGKDDYDTKGDEDALKWVEFLLERGATITPKIFKAARNNYTLMQLLNKYKRLEIQESVEKIVEKLVHRKQIEPSEIESTKEIAVEKLMAVYGQDRETEIINEGEPEILDTASKIEETVENVSAESKIEETVENVIAESKIEETVENVIAEIEKLVVRLKQLSSKN
jgi:urease gamma subunit